MKPDNTSASHNAAACWTIFITGKRKGKKKYNTKDRYECQRKGIDGPNTQQEMRWKEDVYTRQFTRTMYCKDAIHSMKTEHELTR